MPWGWGQAGAYCGSNPGSFRRPGPTLPSASLRLTLIAQLEADVRVTLVGGEEEVEVVAGTDEELGDLGPVVNPNQGRGVCPSISHFQSIIVDLGFKSAKHRDEDFLRNPRLSHLQMIKDPV